MASTRCGESSDKVSGVRCQVSGVRKRRTQKKEKRFEMGMNRFMKLKKKTDFPVSIDTKGHDSSCTFDLQLTTDNLQLNYSSI